MQISRHWRMNAQRYRLEGVRYENGEISLQARPICRDGGCAETEPEARVIAAHHRDARRARRAG